MRGMFVNTKLHDHVTVVALSTRERDALLAGLRLLERALEEDELPDEIRDIAEDTGATLGPSEIEELIDHLQGDG